MSDPYGRPELEVTPTGVYRVHWTIELEAEGHTEAAQEALAYLRDPKSMNAFEVQRQMRERRYLGSGIDKITTYWEPAVDEELSDEQR